MGEWKTYKLGDLVEIKGGKRLPKGEQLTAFPNAHPYIRIRDLGISKELNLNSTFEYVPETIQSSISRYIVNTGDVLLSIVGTIGLTGIVGETLNNANLTENCVKFINYNGILPLFLYYFLKSEVGQSEISKRIVGAVQPKLPIKNIQDIDIQLPDLETQLKITNILSSIDNKIELNNRINHNLEEQAQALYKSWFIDFEPFKDGKFVESELGLIPEGWSIYALEDLMEIRRGSSPRPIQSFLSDSGLRWLKISDATNTASPFVFSIQEHIRQEGLKNTVLRKEGTLVLSNSATPGLPKFLGVDTCIHDGWLYFENSRLSNELMYLLFNHFRQELISQANGSVFMNLKTDILKKMKIAIPSQSTLNAFDNVVKSIFRSIKSRCQEIDILISERDSLLPQLMSGEITC